MHIPVKRKRSNHSRHSVITASWLSSPPPPRPTPTRVMSSLLYPPLIQAPKGGVETWLCDPLCSLFPEEGAARRWYACHTEVPRQGRHAYKRQNSAWTQHKFRLSIFAATSGMCTCMLTASIWSGCSVRIWLWSRLPRDCHRLLSILPTRGASVECPANWCSSLDTTSAGRIGCPGSTGLGVHAGQGSLPPRAAIVAGPVWPRVLW